jgi:hypothetical protein
MDSLYAFKRKPFCNFPDSNIYNTIVRLFFKYSVFVCTTNRVIRFECKLKNCKDFISTTDCIL